MNSKKRILALLMCICMIFTLLPFSALADNAESGNGGLVQESPPVCRLLSRLHRPRLMMGMRK